MQSYPHIENLILASASPRRRELLALLDIPFTVVQPEIDEAPLPDEQPRAFAERMAREKAESISLGKDCTLIAADTIVVLDNTILGKPENTEHAVGMLKQLSGNTHQVLTAVCVRRTNTFIVFSVSTSVEFRALSDAEIEAYVATGEPFDKAGAYAIQGKAAHMVRSINGSYTNVVGLPVCELHSALLSS